MNMRKFLNTDKILLDTPTIKYLWQIKTNLIPISENYNYLLKYMEKAKYIYAPILATCELYDVLLKEDDVYKRNKMLDNFMRYYRIKILHSTDRTFYIYANLAKSYQELPKCDLWTIALTKGHQCKLVTNNDKLIELEEVDIFEIE